MYESAEPTLAISHFLGRHQRLLHQPLQLDLPMRLPIPMVRRRRRLQHPREASTPLPVVRPRRRGVCSGDGADLRSATRRRAIHKRELADENCSGDRPVSSDRLSRRARFWLGRFVLETLVLARPAYFGHT
jgi:hypothetical protein